MEALVRGYAESHADEEFAVQTYHSSSRLLDDLHVAGAADIYVLDIYIDGLSGIEVAREIRQRDAECAIIFLTASPAHAMEAFAVKAVHYLEKPAQPAAFAEAMDRSIAVLAGRRNRAILTCQTTDGIENVPTGDILYIESARQRQNIVLAHRSLSVRRSLAQFFQELQADPAFFMPHRSYIVNLAWVRKVTPEALVMKNGHTLPLPRGEYKRVKKLFMDHSFPAGPTGPGYREV